MAPTDPRREALRRACALYLTTCRQDGRAIDPVAAFHLNNGASVERINWMGDVSEKGLKQSFGLMVNYAYRPQRIERNHEQYVKQGRVTVSESASASCSKSQSQGQCRAASAKSPNRLIQQNRESNRAGMLPLTLRSTQPSYFSNSN